MKRAALILVLGLAGAVAAYCAFYRHGTAKEREILESPAPELAWLKEEFHLGEPEFTRIAIGVINAGPYGRMFTQMFVTP